MGIRNVFAALYVEVDGLSAEARRTLCVLAGVSLDSGPNARLYFGGWRHAMVRQGVFPDEAAKQRFVRHVGQLRKCGLLETLTSPAQGHNAVYRLILPVDNLPFSVDNSADFVENDF